MTKKELEALVAELKNQLDNRDAELKAYKESDIAVKNRTKRNNEIINTMVYDRKGNDWVAIKVSCFRKDVAYAVKQDIKSFGAKYNGTKDNKTGTWSAKDAKKPMAYIMSRENYEAWIANVRAGEYSNRTKVVAQLEKFNDFGQFEKKNA